MVFTWHRRAAFGAIAAETELANLSDAENPDW